MIRIGDKGAKVLEAQRLLASAGYKLFVDGHFGPQTDRIVRAFQKANGLAVDGIIGPRTLAALVSAVHSAPQMEKYMDGPMVWIVMGHGGVDDAGRYTTKIQGGGKFAKHKGLRLHMNTDYFYEGLENRMVGWELVNELVQRRIRYKIVNEQQRDLPLNYLSDLVAADVDLGAWGLVWNIHSNATIGDADGDSFADGEAKGVSVFVERGSDWKASESMRVGRYWRDLTAKTGVNLHSDGIHRRDFWMLNKVPMPSVLEEWRFFDNVDEVEKIIAERGLRAKLAADTIEWALSEGVGRR